jgi:hypothetical protein
LRKINGGRQVSRVPIDEETAHAGVTARGVPPDHIERRAGFFKSHVTGSVNRFQEMSKRSLAVRPSPLIAAPKTMPNCGNDGISDSAGTCGEVVLHWQRSLLREVY